MEDAGTWRRFVSGGGAALTAITLTYPLDFVQTQLTVQTTAKKYTGIVNTLTTVIKEEGFSQLYRGYLATVLVIRIIYYVFLIYYFIEFSSIYCTEYDYLGTIKEICE